MHVAEETKLEFGKKLVTLMQAKGWSQSELARRAEIGRDNVSSYVRGKYFPQPKHLRRLASALAVEPGELMPYGLPANTFLPTMEPALEIIQSATDQDLVWLRISQELPLEVALQIAAMLKQPRKHS